MRAKVVVIILLMSRTKSGCRKFNGSYAHISSMLRTASTWMQSSKASIDFRFP
jgi:hypothetical protein